MEWDSLLPAPIVALAGGWGGGGALKKLKTSLFGQ